MRKEFAVSLIVMFFAALGFVACGSSGGGGGGGGGGGIHTVSLTNGQAADVVIGQPDMISGLPNQGGSANEHTINDPWGNPAVVGGYLYVPDRGNNRVLGFNSIPSVNNAPADFVIGQPDFTTTVWDLTQTNLNGPATVAGDGGKFFLTDSDNNRVLIYNSVPIANGTTPDVVVGQADFTVADTVCDDSSLYYPEGLYAVDGKLIVPDTYNNRVLIWNTIPTINNTPADIVLGQGDFTSCDPNRGGSTARNTMDGPEGAWSDGKRLIVADSDNYRVLIWNTFPTISNTPPDVVVGQPDFNSETPEATQYRLGWCPDLSSNGKQLFVADHDNNRVMVWNHIPTINNTPADRVLGQPDFTTSNNGTGPSSMDTPRGVLVHSNQLIVDDGGNSRYLIFNGQ